MYLSEWFDSSHSVEYGLILFVQGRFCMSRKWNDTGFVFFFKRVLFNSMRISGGWWLFNFISVIDSVNEDLWNADHIPNSVNNEPCAMFNTQRSQLHSEVQRIAIDTSSLPLIAHTHCGSQCVLVRTVEIENLYDKYRNIQSEYQAQAHPLLIIIFHASVHCTIGSFVI